MSQSHQSYVWKHPQSNKHVTYLSSVVTLVCSPESVELMGVEP